VQDARSSWAEGEMKDRPIIASPPWTSEQDARLQTLMASGESPAAIARQLSRTVAAIDSRARKLKIPWLHYKRNLAAWSSSGSRRRNEQTSDEAIGVGLSPRLHVNWVSMKH
jgi:hypothetical protein